MEEVKAAIRHVLESALRSAEERAATTAVLMSLVRPAYRGHGGQSSHRACSSLHNYAKNKKRCVRTSSSRQQLLQQASEQLCATLPPAWIPAFTRFLGER